MEMLNFMKEQIEHADTTLIVAAGMPRSASTWLYNVVRLVLISKIGSENVNCGWIDDVSLCSEKEYTLVKIHNFDPDLVKKADKIVYSFRDVRDAMASMQRKFAVAPSLQEADSFIEQYELWVKHADYAMKYESMIECEKREIERIAASIGMADVDAEGIMRQLSGLSYESGGNASGAYNKENLYHKGHITNGKAESWQEAVSGDLELRIENKHGAWLKELGYPLSRLSSGSKG
jgi:hypothetical protein